MTSTKPLTYPSMNCVLQYMDPNTRFRLSKSCLTIRPIEKKIPLKIETLQLDPLSFKINETTYKVGIICQYTNGENPKFVRKENGKGGLKYDVDKYGLKAGGNRILQSRKDTRDENMIIRALERTPYGSQADLNRRSTNLRAIILPYELRRKNEEPPYSHYIQLVITSTGQNQKFLERIAYDGGKKLHEAMEYLIGTFLRGRNNGIEIRRLQVENGNIMYRLPVKLQTQELKIPKNADEVLSCLRSILKDSPIPLIEVSGSGNFKDPIIKCAQKLVIVGSQLGVLQKCSGRRVHLERCSFCMDEVRKFVKHWQRKPDGIERHYSVAVRDGDSALHFFMHYIGAFRDARSHPESMDPPVVTGHILPINNTHELNVYCEFEREDDYRNSPCVVNFKVQPKGTVFGIVNY